MSKRKSKTEDGGNGAEKVVREKVPNYSATFTLKGRYLRVSTRRLKNGTFQTSASVMDKLPTRVKEGQEKHPVVRKPIGNPISADSFEGALETAKSLVNDAVSKGWGQIVVGPSKRVPVFDAIPTEDML